MNISEKEVEGQVRFWSLLGPFLILLAVAIVLFKMSMHWYLPLGVLIGVPLCIKWKMKGLATALTCLFILFLFSYSRIDLQERYWHLGIGMAIALSFVILTLSLEEVQNLVGKLQLESQSRLDNFLRLDENIKQKELSWNTEKESLVTNVQELSKEMAHVKDERLTFRKLVYLAKDELIDLRTQHERLLQDLLHKTQEVSQLHERLNSNGMPVQELTNTDAQQQTQKLKEELSAYKKQIEHLRQAKDEEIQSLKTNLQILEGKLHQSQYEYRQKMQSLEKSSTDTEASKNHIEQFKQAKDSEIKNLKDTLQINESQLKQIQQELKQKTQLLEKTTQELTSVKSQTESSQYLLSHAQGQVQQAENLLRQHKELFNTQLNAQIKENLDRLSQEKNEELLKFQTQAQELNHQLKLAQTDIANKAQVLDQTVSELSLAKNQLNTLQGKVNEYQEQLQSNERSLNEHQQLFDLELKKQADRLTKAHQEDIQYSRRDIDQLKQLFKTAQEELEKKAVQLSDSTLELSKLKAHVHAMEEGSQYVQQQLEEKLGVIKFLENRSVEVEVKLQQTVQELEEQKKRLLELQKVAANTSTNSNKRGIEAMYTQLKDQFQEKSSILDATRKELFVAQEQLLKLQRENEENERYTSSEEENLLQQDLNRLAKEMDEMQQWNQQEVDELYRLIGDLLAKKSS